MVVEININKKNIKLNYLTNPILKLEIIEKNISIDFGNTPQNLLSKTLCFGMPINIHEVKNITGNQLHSLKYGVNKNLGLSIIHKIIEEMSNYEYFIILSSSGLDLLEIEYLKSFVKAFFSIDNKVFFIEISNKNNINFKVSSKNSPR